MGESKPHVVLVPWDKYGHLIPFLELAKLLVSEDFTVSCITTPDKAEGAQPQVEDYPDIRLVSLQLIPPILEASLGNEGSGNVSIHLSHESSTYAEALAREFEIWLDQQINNDAECSDAPSVTPVCIINDFVMSWVHSSASKFGIPNFVFNTNGAFATSVLHSGANYPLLKEDEEFFEFQELSFTVKLPKSEIMLIVSDPDLVPPFQRYRDRIRVGLEAGEAILINTFSRLDSLGIDHIKRLTSGKPLWCIGPVLPRAVFEDIGIVQGKVNNRGKMADIKEEECLRWLNSREKESVLFVCFGSLFCPSDEQIRALAAVLAATKHPFVWVIGRVIGGEEAEVNLVKELEEANRERALIIWSWAPQLLILSHPSISAFLSHCGWNSTLESISMGVPMITWPRCMEQEFNSKLLVEYQKIAIKLSLDSDDLNVHVVSAVNMLLARDEGNTMRKKAQDLKRHAKIAVDEDGSSYNDRRSLFQEIRKLHASRIATREVEAARKRKRVESLSNE